MPKPLPIEVFKNPLFDTMGPVKTDLSEHQFDPHDLDPHEPDWAYECVTFTDNYVRVGFTYVLRTGRLTIKNEANEILFTGILNSAEDFAGAMKAADRTQKKLNTTKRSSGRRKTKRR